VQHTFSNENGLSEIVLNNHSSASRMPVCARSFAHRRLPDSSARHRSALPASGALSAPELRSCSGPRKSVTVESILVQTVIPSNHYARSSKFLKQPIAVQSMPDNPSVWGPAVVAIKQLSIGTTVSDGTIAVHSSDEFAKAQAPQQQQRRQNR
jgi:hypothetical protein